MKAIIMYGSYGANLMLAEIEKETSEEKLKGYRQPELVYRIVKEDLDCKYSDLETKDVLRENFNFYSDTIGFIGYLMDSYIVPITDDNYNSLIESYKKKFNDIVKYYEEKINAFKNENNLIKRNIMLDKILNGINKIDDTTKQKELRERFLKVIKEIRQEIEEKARVTGERQVLSKRNVKCNNTKEECNFDIITEYVLPNSEVVEEREHTY